MLDVSKATEVFRKVLCETAAYREYDRAKKVMKENEALWEELCSFRKRRYEFQMLSSTDELFERTEALEKQEEALRQNKDAAAFLDAELALCRMMQDIFLSMVDSVDFE